MRIYPPIGPKELKINDLKVMIIANSLAKKHAWGLKCLALIIKQTNSCYAIDIRLEREILLFPISLSMA